MVHDLNSVLVAYIEMNRLRSVDVPSLHAREPDRVVFNDVTSCPELQESHIKHVWEDDGCLSCGVMAYFGDRGSTREKIWCENRVHSDSWWSAEVQSLDRRNGLDFHSHSMFFIHSFIDDMKIWRLDIYAYVSIRFRYSVTYGDIFVTKICSCVKNRNLAWVFKLNNISFQVLGIYFNGVQLFPIQYIIQTWSHTAIGKFVIV